MFKIKITFLAVLFFCITLSPKDTHAQTFDCATVGNYNGVTLVDQLTAITNQGLSIRHVAIAPNGGWVILYGTAGWYYCGIPPLLAEQMEFRRHDQIKFVAFSQTNGWIMLFGQKDWVHHNIPPRLTDMLGQLWRENRRIDSVAFDANDAWIVLHDRGWNIDALPLSIYNVLRDLDANSLTITSISFSPNSSFIVFEGNGQSAWYSSVFSDGLTSRAEYLRSQNIDIASVSMQLNSDNSAWIIVLDNGGWVSAANSSPFIVTAPSLFELPNNNPDTPNAGEFLPDFEDYAWFDSSDVIDLLDDVSEIIDINAPNIIRFANNLVECYHDVGALAGRIYTNDLESFGVVAVTNLDLVSRHTPECILDSATGMLFSVGPCVSSGTFEYQGDRLVYIYAATDQEFCDQAEHHFSQWE